MGDAGIWSDHSVLSMYGGARSVTPMQPAQPSARRIEQHSSAVALVAQPFAPKGALQGRDTPTLFLRASAQTSLYIRPAPNKAHRHCQCGLGDRAV